MKVVNYGIKEEITNYSWENEIIAAAKRVMHVDSLDVLVPKAKALVDEYVRVRSEYAHSGMENSLYEYCASLLSIALKYQNEYEENQYFLEHFEEIEAKRKEKEERERLAFLAKKDNERRIRMLNLSAEAIYA